MKRLLEEGRTLKPDGSPGYVVKFDPEQRVFKQALIAITFSGIYFEAFAYFVARQISKSKAEKVDKARGYRAKLEELGVEDAGLLEAAESFRKSRNELVHEKAAPMAEIDFAEAHFAESCADKAMEFIALLHQSVANVR